MNFSRTSFLSVICCLFLSIIQLISSVDASAQVDAGRDTTICNGSKVLLNGSVNGRNKVTLNADYSSYSWSPSAGLSNSHIKNPTASPVATTTYTLTVSDRNGVIGKDSIKIYVNPVPTKPIIAVGGHTQICAGESVKLKAGSPDAFNLSYQWYNNDNAISGVTTKEYIAKTSGAYQVKVSSGCGSSVSSDIIKVTVGQNCSKQQPTKVYTLGAKEFKPSQGKIGPAPMYVHDRWGDSVLLENIAIPTNSQVAGIFRLHFYDEDHGLTTGFNDATLGFSRRQVVAQVFEDISKLISSTGNLTGLPNAYPSLTRPYVEIDVRSGVISMNGSPQPNALGAATQYYLEQGRGITYGEMWELIHTGFDPYSGLSNTSMFPARGYYHGMVQINLSYNWYLNLSAASPGVGQHDLYTVTLHEVLHALGLHSTIGPTGASDQAPGRYNLFDTYLKVGTGAGNYLINDNTAQNCHHYDFAPSASVLTSGCNNIYFNGSNLVNHLIYSPSSWEGGSSLSHFNCPSSSGYALNAQTTSQYVQRTPHINEVKALCDLGYRITGQYGGAYSFSTQTYSGVCGNSNPLAVSGVNDFRPYASGNIQSDFSVRAGSSITLGRADILDNDIGPGGSPQDATLKMSCLELVQGAGTITSVSNSGFIYTPPSWFYGVAMFRYRPETSAGIRGNITYIFINVQSQSPLPCAGIDNCNLLGCGGTMESRPNDNFYVIGQNSIEHTYNNVNPVAAYFPTLSNNGTVWPGTCSGANWPIAYPQEGLYYTSFGAFTSSSEGITIPLVPSTALTPGKTYRISFWAQSMDPENCESTFSVYLSDNPPCPSAAPGDWDDCGTFNPVLVNNFKIDNKPNVWTQYYIDYLVPAGTAFDNLTIINNKAFLGSRNNAFGFIDNVIIEEAPVVNITSTVSSPSCIGGTTTITYNVCLNPGRASNPNPIQLTVNQVAGLTIGTGGNFPSGGIVTIPANTLTTAQPCTTLVLKLNIGVGVSENVALQNLLNISDGICDQNPQTLTDEVIPEVCTSTIGASINKIAVGMGTSSAVCNDGSVWSWGYNANLPIPDGSSSNAARTVPSNIISLSSIKSVSVMSFYTMAVKNDGTVWGWGQNYYGQLGDGSTVDRINPQQATISNVKLISAGTYHSLAVKNDGTVWAWGNNSNGQLGDGSTTSKNTPQQITSLGTNVSDVSAGADHSLALKNDGTVWAWGRNSHGQIGNNSNVDVVTPIQVLTDAVKISTGFGISLALKNNGTLWVWGTNSFGLLGDGSSTNVSLIPIQITSIGSVKSFDAGDGYILVLKNDGTVWAWGNNIFGTLGNGSTSSSNLISQIGSLSGIQAISAGRYNCLAIKNDGSLWSWGINQSGESGIGTISSYEATPRQVTISANCFTPSPQFAFSNSTSMNGNSSDIIAFPNPFTQAINIQVAGTEGDVYQIEIISVEGQLMETKKNLPVNQEVTVGESLPKGLYFVKASNSKISKSFKVNKL